MENNTLFKCWPSSCLPSCLVSKGRCPCRIKKFRNRVGPSKPFVVAISKGTDSAEAPTLPEANHHSKFNGETNLYFQGDEVSFETGGESHLNGHSSSLANGDCVKSIPSDPEVHERLSVGEEPESCLTQGFYEFLSTVFLQLSKSKQLRVIHIKGKRIDGHPLVQSSVGHVDGGNKLNSEEEDEDYWFTKWSRRPKLKNTFKPKVKTKSSRHENEKSPDVISRIGQTNEQIQIKQEHKEQKETMVVKEQLRKTCSSPTFPLNRDPSASPPSSPTRHSDSHWNNAELPRNSKPSDNYESERPSDDNFQQDLDHSCRADDSHENSPSAFTNFGFQLEPEDSGLPPEPNMEEKEGRLQDESQKTAEAEIHLGRDDNQSNGNSRSSPAFQGSIKCNGFGRSMSSPSRLETSLESTGRVSPAEISPEPEIPPAADNSKPLLFFIHGISGSSDVWKSQFKFFHELGYEIVAPDLLGHGMSSTPNNAKHYLFESLVQDLVAVFDHFVAESRITVIIGHGYGACMGNVLSRLRSQNISLLISVSGGGPTPLIPYGSLERHLLPIRFNIFRKKKPIGRFDNPDLRHVLPKSIHQHILDGQLWVDGDAAFHRRISVPTLLVYGMRDTVVSLIEECEMERTIPKAFLELLPTAGHMVMWDEPHEFNRMLMKFIQGWVDLSTN